MAYKLLIYNILFYIQYRFRSWYDNETLSFWRKLETRRKGEGEIRLGKSNCCGLVLHHSG